MNLHPTGCRWLAAISAVLLASAVVSAEELPDVLPYGSKTLPSTPTERIDKTLPRMIDLLGERAGDPYAPTRVQMQTELGLTRRPAAAKYIKIGLTDPDPQVRAAAAKSAGLLGDKSLVGDLKKLIQDKDARVRREVVLSGAALGDTSAITAGLDDKDSTVVVAAVSVAEVEQAPKLAASLASYPPAMQIIAVNSLGRTGDAKYADAVASLTGSAVPLRSAVAVALGRMKAASRSADVIKLLGDEHPTVRRSALAAVAGVTSEAEGQKRFIVALADQDTPVRESAARLLQKSPTPDAIAALASNLSADSTRMHQAALDALVAIGQPVIPTAEKMLADASPRRREDASFILGALKSDAGFAAHLALLKDADWKVARQAAVSLGQIGRKDASPAMAELATKATTLTLPMTSPEYVDAAAAIEQAIASCAIFGEVSILPMCKTLLPEKTRASGIRSAAAYAIGRLSPMGDKSVVGLLSKPIPDQIESADVQFECVKAMGHLKLQAVLAFIGKDRESSKWPTDATGDWMSHWIRCRLAGKVEPLAPIQEHWWTNTSVTPIE